MLKSGNKPRIIFGNPPNLSGLNTLEHQITHEARHRKKHKP
jgi:hypothetical protein